MDSHIETIKCPECNKVQQANVLHTEPWFTYVHECDQCKHTIMESEWIKIDSNNESKPVGEEWLKIMMSLVRVGYQHASTEIFSYCIDNKVSPQFTDLIASMLNEDNKKKFSYEMFATEINKIQEETFIGWISVEDRLPDENQRVLVCKRTGHITIATYYGIDQFKREKIFVGTGGAHYDLTWIKYWKLLPTSPIKK